MDLASAYRSCARVTRREARNFYYAFLSLPRRQRQAVYALYAFCREADDVVDLDAPYGASKSITLDSLGEAVQPSGAECKDQVASRDVPEPLRGKSTGDAPARSWADCEGSESVASKRERLAWMRGRLTRAAAGAAEAEPDLALADAIDRFGVDPGDLDDVLTGMEMDLCLSRFATFDELRTYCYHAASAVGLATLPILNAGVPPTDAMREAAVDLGLGMQFVNILRDVAEDLDRDRIYLPTEEMDAFGVDEAALRRRSTTDALTRLLSHQADRAGEYLARGRRLLPLLPRNGRRCPWLLAELYGRILMRIRDADYAVFEERIGLSKWEKIKLLLASYWR